MDYPRRQTSPPDRGVNLGGDSAVDLTQALASFAVGGVDAAAVADAAARRASAVLGDMCIVTRLTPDRASLNVVALHHPDPATVDATRASFGSRPYPADRGPAGRVIASGRAMLMSAGSADLDEGERRYMAQFAIESWILAPLNVRGRVIGTFGIWRRTGRPAYSEADLDLACRIADQVALAIGAEQLMLEAERGGDRVHRLGLVVEAIRDGADDRVALAVLADQVRREDGVDAALVALLDGPSGTTVVAASGLYAGRRLVGTRRPLSAAARRALESGVEVELHAREGALTLPGAGVVAGTTVVPLVAGGRQLGVLELYTRDGFALDGAGRRFIEVMAGLAASAIGAGRGRRAAGAGAVEAPALNASQRAILDLLLEGRSNRQIAEAVHLSENTVKFHISELFRKTGTHNRVELVQRALRFG